MIKVERLFCAQPSVSLLGKAEFQTLISQIFIEFKLWLFLVTNINMLTHEEPNN
jgi:hypothetical protein